MRTFVYVRGQSSRTSFPRVPFGLCGTVLILNFDTEKSSVRCRTRPRCIVPAATGVGGVTYDWGVGGVQVGSGRRVEGCSQARLCELSIVCVNAVSSAYVALSRNPS
eukprot:scaffold803_cov367-Pavlova_lutheri.AAC.2